MIGKKVDSKNNKFLKIYSEKDNFNQYWFSENTIDFIIKQVEKHTNGRIAFVSTPSTFFSCSEELKDKSILFDFDEVLIKKHKNGVKFDYNEFSEVAKEYENIFDFIVIDPPFITEQVWSKYADFAKVISKKSDKNEECAPIAKILASSIAENKNMLKSLLDLDIKPYQPSIPHLVYQYNFYSNYEDEELQTLNTEIID
jgi:hypothetical protein